VLFFLFWEGVVWTYRVGGRRWPKWLRCGPPCPLVGTGVALSVFGVVCCRYLSGALPHPLADATHLCRYPLRMRRLLTCRGLFELSCLTLFCCTSVHVLWMRLFFVSALAFLFLAG